MTPTSRVAVITGASQGLGAVIARFLAPQGYDLLLVARDPGRLRRFAQELGPRAHGVAIVAGSIEDPETRAEVRRTAERLGGVDLLVNNASELGPSPLPALEHLPPAAMHHVFDVNVVAPLALVQELLPSLRARRGLVVNVSSDAALGGYPGWGAYGASKAALDLVSKTLAAELRDAGVSVVSVDPGDMRTAMHQAAYPGVDIGDRPLPEVTLPFWAWLLGQEPAEVTGRRFQAQGGRWELAP